MRFGWASAAEAGATRGCRCEWTEMREWAVEESDKEVVMRLELPGFEAQEIEPSGRKPESPQVLVFH
jgi:hypothetical protein